MENIIFQDSPLAEYLEGWNIFIEDTADSWANRAHRAGHSGA